MATYEDYEQVLSNNRGTEHHYKHTLCSYLLYTDGIKDMAETLQCYWLVDMIASYIPDMFKFANKMSSDRFVFPTVVAENNKATFKIISERYNGDEAKEVALIKQRIPFTDLPDGEYKLYLEYNGSKWVLFLSSEY